MLGGVSIFVAVVTSYLIFVPHTLAAQVSSLPLVSGSAPPEYEDLHPLIKRVHAAYGADRLMWASDQTQTMGKARGTYTENADIIRKYAAAYLPAADIQKMMHETATKIFKSPLDPGPGDQISKDRRTVMVTWDM